MRSDMERLGGDLETWKKIAEGNAGEASEAVVRELEGAQEALRAAGRQVEEAELKEQHEREGREAAEVELEKERTRLKAAESEVGDLKKDAQVLRARIDVLGAEVVSAQGLCGAI